MFQSTLLFGGSHEQTSKSCSRDEGLDELLGALSWKFVKREAEFEPYRPPAPDDEDAVREEIVQWAQRVWCHLNDMPEGDELSSFDIFSLEQQYRAYIEANGASLFERGSSVDEIWCGMQLGSSKPFMFFLSERFADAASDRVTPKYVERPDVLVWLIAALGCRMQINRPLLNVLVTNGEEGHTIVFAGLNPVEYEHPRGVTIERGWLSFHDPWPARSLLAPEHDYGGAAVEDIARPPFWLLSPDDLAKVIVGFTLSIDFQEDIEDFLGVARRLAADEGRAGAPIWIEHTAMPSILFPILSLSHGGSFGPEVLTLLGLARWALMNGDVNEAEERFEAAYRLDRMEAAGAANQLYHRFGHTQLAGKWYRRLFGGG